MGEVNCSNCDIELNRLIYCNNKCKLAYRRDTKGVDTKSAKVESDTKGVIQPNEDINVTTVKNEPRSKRVGKQEAITPFDLCKKHSAMYITCHC